MKIIRPMDLTGTGVVESNAPGDGYTTWEPIGRSNQFSGDQWSISGNTAYVIRSGMGGFIDIYDISTGEKTGEIEADKDVVDSVSASPDGAFLAYVERNAFNPFEYRLFVRDLTTDQTVYSTNPFVSSYVFSSMAWSNNSSFFSYIRNSYFPVVIATGSWGTVNEGDNLLSQLSVGTVSTSYLGGSAINDSGELFVAVKASGDSGTQSRLIKLSSSAAYIDDAFISSSTTILGVYLNGARGEVFAYGDSPGAMFSQSTLSSVTTPAILSGYAIWGMDESHDGSELAAWSLSVQPYTRRVATADYSSLTAFPTTESGRVSYADDYFLVSAGSGEYEIVDLATNTIITQTNPSVTAGDIYTYNNHNYEALQDNNDRPDVGALADQPTWLDLGFINPLRMFDNKLDSKTTAPSPLVIDITPGMLVNGLALFNVDAATVQITYTDPTDGLVYDTGQISMLDNSGVQDWYGFFFDPYLVKADLARVDLPAYIDGTVQITLDGAGADVAIGEVVLGTIYKIGDAQYGSSAGIIDFSRKEADQFGNFEIVPRRFSKRAEFDAVIPPAYGGSVQRTLARLRATPVVWIGSVDLEETIVYGYFREFDILLSNPAFSNVTITVEGL